LNKPDLFSLLKTSNYHSILLGGGIALALGVRVFALLALQESLYCKFLLWDEEYYHGWAQAISLGDIMSASYQEYAPLPAYLMALVYKLFGPEILLIRYANIVLGTGTCLLIYLISRELSGKSYALIALFCAALCKPLIFYSIVPLKTSLSVFLFAVFVYLILYNRRRNSWLGPIFLGVVFGLIFNVRPNVLILLPILPFLLHSFSDQRSQIVKNLAKAGILIATGIILSVSPFVIRNYLLNEHIRITPLQSGFLLYANNNYSNSSPYYQPVPFASSHPKEQGVQFTIEASRRMGRKLTASEASDFWKNEVLTRAAEDPWYWLQKLGQKTLSFLSFAEVDDHYHIGFIASLVSWFSYPFLPYWFFFLLGITGLTAGMTQRKTRSCLWPLAMIFFSYGATLLVYSTGTRFQLPLLVILLPVSLYSCKRILFLFQKRALKKISVYLFLLFSFTMSGVLPLQGGSPMAGHYNTYAFLLNRNNQEGDAISWWEKSASLHEPYSAYANLFLSGKYYHRYGMERAVAILEDISDQSFAAAAKYATLGDILLHHGQLEQALESYEKSLAINGGQQRVRQEVIKLLRHKNNKRLKKEIEQLEVIRSFYN
jgi:4-amino-4-deoxy-L-arabinose transferase-like glycosyltransferase